MTEKINGTIYVGSLSTIIFCCAAIGNTALGPLKGFIDGLINESSFGRIIAGIIPQIIFGILVSSVYFDNTNAIIASIISWHLIGMPFISANDCLIDEASSKILNSASSFALVQYIGTKIIARIGFSYISDNYDVLKDIITIISLISIIFGISVHFIALRYYPNRKQKVHAKTEEPRIIQRKTYSFLWFAPLFFVIFEAFFLDTSLSSLKFITPRFREDKNPVIFSSTFISSTEIVTSIVFTIVISFSENLDKISFREKWQKYTKLHSVSTICRTFLTILLVYLMKVQVVDTYNTNDFIIANVTKKSFSEKKVIHYGISKMVNLTWIKALIIIITIVNAMIDAYSSIMIIVLVKSYSKNIKIRYSTLDGFIRFFTYLPAIVPWIKRNPLLSVYSSDGYIIHTLFGSLVLYAIIFYWNWHQMRKIKEE